MKQFPPETFYCSRWYWPVIAAIIAAGTIAILIARIP